MPTRLLYTLVLCTISILSLSAQSDNDKKAAAFSAFSPLLNQTWYAHEEWDNGQTFKQEVTFVADLGGNIIKAESKGYTDEEQTKWGKRNHGVRRWNSESQRMEFFEFDALGGLTEGYLTFQHDSIYYHYEYGGNSLTDAWEPDGSGSYNFTIGVFKNSQWTDVYLQTQFSTQKPMMMEDEALPYREIPPAPTEFTATTVAARMIDGLGFRYYWATEGLREEDLAYRIGEGSRTSAETIDHIYGLTEVVHNAVLGEPIVRSREKEALSFPDKRRITLQRLKAASDHLRAAHPAEMTNMEIIFQRGDRNSVYPFWNNLNGPLADAIWHVGQVVMLRRASGNPFNSKVSVFNGKLRE